MLPIMKALDTNGDGELDATEIAMPAPRSKHWTRTAMANSPGMKSCPKPPEGLAAMTARQRDSNRSSLKGGGSLNLPSAF